MWALGKHRSFLKKKKKKLFIYFYYVFLAALGLCGCTRAFSSCSMWGLFFDGVCGLLIVVASLIVEHQL